jgi:hypothetical protein
MGFADLVMTVDRTVQGHLGSVTVTYRSKAGVPLFVEVPGMFDANFLLDAQNDHTGIETRGPAVFVRTEDLPTDPTDWDDPVCTIQGIDYAVVGRKPDSLGGLTLLLHRVDPIGVA